MNRMAGADGGEEEDEELSGLLLRSKSETAVRTRRKIQDFGRIPVLQETRPESPSLPTRTQLQTKRKVFHLFAGFIISFVYYRFLPRATFEMVIWSIVATSFSVEMLKLHNWTVNDLFKSLAEPLLRDNEVSRSFSGSFYYLLGCAITTSLYDKPTAVLSIICMACLDPVAAAVGFYTSSVEWPILPNGKSVLGFCASATVCSVFIYFLCLEWPVGAFFAIKVGIIAALAELLVPSPQIVMRARRFPLGFDDNVIIPVVAGFAITELTKRLELSMADLPQLRYLDLSWLVRA